MHLTVMNQAALPLVRSWAARSWRHGRGGTVVVAQSWWHSRGGTVLVVRCWWYGAGGTVLVVRSWWKGMASFRRYPGRPLRLTSLPPGCAGAPSPELVCRDRGGCYRAEVRDRIDGWGRRRLNPCRFRRLNPCRLRRRAAACLNGSMGIIGTMGPMSKSLRWWRAGKPSRRSVAACIWIERRCASSPARVALKRSAAIGSDRHARGARGAHAGALSLPRRIYGHLNSRRQEGCEDGAVVLQRDPRAGVSRPLGYRGSARPARR
jgi:hypothetical protein